MILALALVVLAAPEAAPDAGARSAAAAVRRLDAFVRGGGAEERELAKVAVVLAGESAVAPLAARMTDPSGSNRAAAAWALGLAAAPQGVPGPGAAAAAAALTPALADPDSSVRVAAAASLGRLRHSPASSALAALLLDRQLDSGERLEVHLALAGAGGRGAAVLEGLVDEAGGPQWAADTTQVLLRRGRDAWPELARATREAASPRSRALAGIVLLLLAEPRAWCELAEAQAMERDPRLRRVLLQAVAAGAAPEGRQFLRWAAVSEADPELRRAAALLWRPPTRSAPELPADRARALLARIADGPAPHGVLDDLALLDDASLAPAIDDVARALPLRGGGDWLAEHAALAQVAARLRCAADPDCSR